MFCREVQGKGGCAWLVGGCVRDLTMGVQPKDWDLEVFGLSPNLLKETISALGTFTEVGRKFGVFKARIAGLELDVALPRTERKSGEGHQGFEVFSNPELSTDVAVLRRDFTINAMMYNSLDGQLLDYHGGRQDLQNGVLRHVSAAFDEDPLRPLRGMQFAARFQMVLADGTADRCLNLLSEAKTLPVSRCWEEWKKWAISDYPDYGLLALKKMGWLMHYSSLQSLVGCQQNERWHPEGDVWTHTVQVVRVAAELAKERGLVEKERLVLVLAALCHDMGKPLTTRKNEAGELVATGHARAGVAVAGSFLNAIGVPKTVVAQVLQLVGEHGAHFAEEVSDSAVLKLAYRLKNVGVYLWEVLTEADASGCAPRSPERPAYEWLEKAVLLGVERSPVSPLLTGKVLLQWGVKPSREMGLFLDRAYQAQMEGEFYDESSARNWFKKCGVATLNN